MNNDTRAREFFNSVNFIADDEIDNVAADLLEKSCNAYLNDRTNATVDVIMLARLAKTMVRLAAICEARDKAYNDLVARTRAKLEALVRR